MLFLRATVPPLYHLQTCQKYRYRALQTRPVVPGFCNMSESTGFCNLYRTTVLRTTLGLYGTELVPVPARTPAPLMRLRLRLRLAVVSAVVVDEGRRLFSHCCRLSRSWGGLVALATVRSRDFFVNYPVSFSLRYLYIRPISRHVCLSVCLFVCRSKDSSGRLPLHLALRDKTAPGGCRPPGGLQGGGAGRGRIVPLHWAVLVVASRVPYFLLH